MDKNIVYNKPVSFEMLREMKRPIISTLPIMVLSKLIGLFFDVGKKKLSSIYVYRYKIDDCEMYSTLYYPDLSLNIYRASITGDVLSVESIDSALSQDEFCEVLESFGVHNEYVTRLSSYHQEYGKLIDIDESVKENFIVDATINHGIYSLGRFAVWRNILLDDVLKDIYKIREMMNKGHYEYLRNKV